MQSIYQRSRSNDEVVPPMKRISHIPVCTALMLSLLAAGARAQQKTESTDAARTDDSTQGSQLKVNPLKALEQFEPPVDEAYQLGAGDTINVYVAGHPELTRSYQIGPDGFITIDIVGSIKVTNLTRDAAAKEVSDKLARYYTNPAVTIGVDKYGSNTVKIFGSVQHPGVLAYEGTTPTLLDALGRGGLIVNPSSKDGLPERCVIYRGSDTVVQVELRQLMMSSSPLSDIRLRRGDAIFVPVDRQRFVSVLGQVGKPGLVQLTPDLDLKMALSEAGGLKDEAGDNPTVHVVQTANNRELTIPYKQLMTPGGGKEIVLQPGDVVLIGRSGFNSVTYVLTKLSPAATMISLASLVIK
jgi:polysaccharide export outer membrane protein